MEVLLSHSEKFGNGIYDMPANADHASKSCDTLPWHSDPPEDCASLRYGSVVEIILISLAKDFPGEEFQQMLNVDEYGIGTPGHNTCHDSPRAEQGIAISPWHKKTAC
jgi:hypothetical protein